MSRNQQWVVVDSMGQTIYHACGWESEYINAALKSAVTALITHGIINPALCSPYFHINREYAKISVNRISCDKIYA